MTTYSLLFIGYEAVRILPLKRSISLTLTSTPTAFAVSKTARQGGESPIDHTSTILYFYSLSKKFNMKNKSLKLFLEKYRTDDDRVLDHSSLGYQINMLAVM